MNFLDASSAVRLDNGEERALPEKPDFRNMGLRAKVDAGGRILADTLEVVGGNAAIRDAARPMLASVFQQLVEMKSIRLQQGRSVPSEHKMQVPLPGLAILDVRMRVDSRLLETVEGIAKIEATYSMEFDVPTGPIKIQATGSGGGLMLYQVATKIVRRDESSTRMTFIADTPDGVLEFQINAKETQVIRDATRP